MIIIVPGNGITKKKMLHVYSQTRFCFALILLLLEAFVRIPFLFLCCCHYRCLYGYSFALHLMLSSLAMSLKIMHYFWRHCRCLYCMDTILFLFSRLVSAIVQGKDNNIRKLKNTQVPVVVWIHALGLSKQINSEC